MKKLVQDKNTDLIKILMWKMCGRWGGAPPPPPAREGVGEKDDLISKSFFL
jgi:hypothetical protein